MQRLKITTIKSGGYAEQIGLQVGDLLDTLNDRELETPDDLTNGLNAYRGQQVKFFVYRNSARIVFDASSQTLGVIVASVDRDTALAEQDRFSRIERMVISTAPHIHEYEICETIGIVTAERVFGMNILKDIFASVTDIVGGRSDAVQEVLRDARTECLYDLRRNAANMGANAVISVNLEHNEMGGGGKSMLYVVATGTAVRTTKRA